MSVSTKLAVLLLLSLLLPSQTRSQMIKFNYLQEGSLIYNDNTYNFDATSLLLSTSYSFQLSPWNLMGLHFFVLNADGVTYSTRGGGTIPPYISVTPGPHTWTIELHEGVDVYFNKTAFHTVHFTVLFSMYAVNNFRSGIINVRDETQNSGYIMHKVPGASVNLGAIDQEANGYQMVWKYGGEKPSNWHLGKYKTTAYEILGATEREYTHTVESDDNHAEIIADMRRICNVNVQTNFSNMTNIGKIVVNGMEYNSPAQNFVITEGDGLSMTATDQEYLDVEYAFNHWEDGSTNRTRTVYPNSHCTYTAYYTGVPVFRTLRLNVTQMQNEPLQLSWSDHPNPGITEYHIWRKYKDVSRSVRVGPAQIGTVPRGSTTFTDWDCIYTGSQLSDLVFYDIRPYSSYDMIESAETWNGPYGAEVELYKRQPGGDSLNAQIPADKETSYSLNNYPNPFNPSTRVRYSIKESGFVSLKVYDILGNLVKELVNEYKPAGNYSVSFDGSSLPSGIYISSIRSGSYTETKKMLLIK